MCNAAFKGVRERILMKNIAYAGALAALLDLDTDVVRALLEGEVRQEAGADGLEPEGRRPRVRLRQGALRRARCRSGSRRMDATTDSILIDGNTAAALGCVYAGATVGAWYPITPSTSLMDAFTRLLRRSTAWTRDRARTATRSSRPRTSSRRSAW